MTYVSIAHNDSFLMPWIYKKGANLPGEKWHFASITCNDKFVMQGFYGRQIKLLKNLHEMQ